MEHAPIPYVVFIFKFIVGSIKELGVRQTNKRGNADAMGTCFISKASPPPPFGSSFDRPFSTSHCTTKNEHLHLFFQF
jgi:hypothetical protein